MSTANNPPSPPDSDGRASLLVPPGSGERLRTENEPEVRVEPRLHGVPIAILEHDIEPMSLGTPHFHEDEDQVAYVLEGTIGYMVGEQEFLAEAGSLVVRPRGIPHVLWNPTDAPARMLEITVPGTLMEYFHAANAALDLEGEAREAAMSEARAASTVVDRSDLLPELEARHGVKRPEGSRY